MGGFFSMCSARLILRDAQLVTLERLRARKRLEVEHIDTCIAQPPLRLYLQLNRTQKCVVF